MGLGNSFKGRQFTAEVILWAVRWYLMFPVSYRDLELMLLDRGVEVDHTTIFRWIQAYAAELEKPIRSHLRMSNGSWRVDETYIRVKGRRTYLYPAVDSRGQTIDFLLAARRDTAAAKRFFRKAMAQPHVANPGTLTVDKNPAESPKLDQRLILKPSSTRVSSQWKPWVKSPRKSTSHIETEIDSHVAFRRD
jgi:transposase, IS6 family